MKARTRIFFGFAGLFVIGLLLLWWPPLTEFLLDRWFGGAEARIIEWTRGLGVILASYSALGVVALSRDRENADKWLGTSGAGWLNFWLCFALFLWSNPFYTGHYVWLRLLLLIFGFIWFLRWFGLGVLRPIRLKIPGRKHSINATLSVLLFLFIFAEAIFLFVRVPHGNGQYLSARSWFAKYWEVNERGLRQDAAVYEKAKSTKRILVLGDSFAAGHGIENPANTFPARLDSLLGPEFTVLNYGVPGYNPKLSYQLLTEHDPDPDFLILQWYMNDIEDAYAEISGKKVPHKDPVGALPWILRGPVGHSLSLNFLFSRFSRPKDGEAYLAFLEAAFSSSPALIQQEEELAHFRDYAMARGIPFMIVGIPFLQAPDKFEQGYTRLQMDCRQLAMRFEDVGKWVADIPVQERTVNQFDAHASEKVHARIAEQLAPIVLGWSHPAPENSNSE